MGVPPAWCFLLARGICEPSGRYSFLLTMATLSPIPVCFKDSECAEGQTCQFVLARIDEFNVSRASIRFSSAPRRSSFLLV